MKLTLSILTATIFAVCVGAPRASGAVLANWTFEVSHPANGGPHNAEAGLFAGAQSTANRTTNNSPNYASGMPGNGSAWSFSSTLWRADDSYQFKTVTTGQNTITFEWCWTRSAPEAPPTFFLEWSTNGTNFNFVSNQNVAVATWSAATPNANSCVGPIAMPAGLNNQANAFIRLRAQDDTLNPGATVRVDNVIINGVPEPGSLILLAVGGIVFLRRRT